MPIWEMRRPMVRTALYHNSATVWVDHQGKIIDESTSIKPGFFVIQYNQLRYEIYQVQKLMPGTQTMRIYLNPVSEKEAGVAGAITWIRDIFDVPITTEKETTLGKITEKEFHKEQVLKAVADLMRHGLRAVCYKDLERRDLGGLKNIQKSCNALLKEGKLYDIGRSDSIKRMQLILAREIVPSNVTVKQVITSYMKKMAKENSPQLRNIRPRFEYVIETKGKVRVQDFTADDALDVLAGLMAKYSAVYVNKFSFVLRRIFTEEAVKGRVKENVFYDPRVIKIMDQLRSSKSAIQPILPTVADMVDLAISNIEQTMTIRSAETYNLAIRRFADHAGASTPLESITSKEVVGFLENHRIDHKAKSTMVAISALKRMFEVAIREEIFLMADSPMQDAEVRKVIESLNAERSSQGQKSRRKRSPRRIPCRVTEEIVPDVTEVAIMDAAPAGFWARVKQFFV